MAVSAGCKRSATLGFFVPVAAVPVKNRAGAPLLTAGPCAGRAAAWGAAGRARSGCSGLTPRLKSSQPSLFVMRARSRFWLLPIWIEHIEQPLALHDSGTLCGNLAIAPKDVAANRPLNRTARVLCDQQTLERPAIRMLRRQPDRRAEPGKSRINGQAPRWCQRDPLRALCAPLERTEEDIGRITVEERRLLLRMIGKSGADARHRHPPIRERALFFEHFADRDIRVTILPSVT